MNRMVKKLSLLLVLIFAMSLLSGCKSDEKNGATDTDTTAPAKESAASGDVTVDNLEEVELTVYVAGDEPVAHDEVIKEIENRTKSELNIKLNVVYIPWSDYMTKMNLKLSSESFDIFLNFNGDMIKMASQGAVLSLNDLLDTYGSDLKNVIPEGEFAGVSIDGSIYGVPSIYPRVDTSSYIIRKDLREKYGIPVINTLEDFEAYLSAVKANEPDLIPLAVSGNAGTALLRALDPDYINKWAYKGVINIAEKPYVVENQMRSSMIVDWVNWARKAYLAGWLNEDAATQKDPGGLVRSGKATATSWDLYGMQGIQGELSQNVPGAVLEIVHFEKEKPYIATEGSNNLATISATSKNPERAMMFLNWIRKSLENYDLYMYGIEGKTYKMVDDKVELITENGAALYSPTPWYTKQLSYDRTFVTDTEEFIEAFDFYKNLGYTSSEIQGFNPDLSKFSTEAAYIDTLVSEKWTMIQSGLADYDESVVEEIENAGLTVILEEIQRQLDEYCQKNGIAQ